ncbi:hypothetical protein NHH03_23315 [Stieleria sp. TO1_6]|nr:hypothetical protein [Stieleria tagensis]
MRNSLRSHTTLVCLAICLASNSIGHSQVMLSPTFQQYQPAEAANVAPRTIQLAAQQQPDPLLRYRLWPAPEYRRPRPAMVAVNRALLLVSQVSPREKRQFLQQYDQWSASAIDEIPLEQAKAICQPFATAISVLRSGENWMDLAYDLGIEEMSTREKAATLLPEYQEMRDLARLLSLRVKVAAAEQRWEDAIADLRLGFRLSEIASHATDTLLGRVIGIAIANVMMETIEVIISQPDCPSLYWALAGVPIERMTEMRQALEYESTLASQLGNIAGLPALTNQMIGQDAAVVRLKEILDAYATDFQSTSPTSQNVVLRQLSTGLYVAMMVPMSRELLSHSPDWKDRVADLSDAEAVLRASDFELARIRDRWLAWSSLPQRQRNQIRDIRDTQMTTVSDSNTIGAQFARQLLPAVDQAFAAATEARQRHHRLISLEALRLHAGQTGELPESIQNLSPVPAWDDSLSETPFEYVRKSATHATLSRARGLRNQDDLVVEIHLQVAQ